MNWMKSGAAFTATHWLRQVRWTKAVNEVITTLHSSKPIHEVFDGVCAASHIAPTFHTRTRTASESTAIFGSPFCQVEWT